MTKINRLVKILVIFSLVFISYSCSDGYDIIEVQTIRGKEIKLDDYNIPSIVVLSSSLSCHDCYVELAKIVRTLRDSMKYKISLIVVIPFNKDVIFANKTQMKMVKNLLNQDTTFFDIPLKEVNSDINTKLFNKYSVQSTPAVILINKKRTLFLSNNELFSQKNSYNKNLKRFKDFISD